MQNKSRNGMSSGPEIHQIRSRGPWEMRETIRKGAAVISGHGVCSGLWMDVNSSGRDSISLVGRIGQQRTGRAR